MTDSKEPRTSPPAVHADLHWRPDGLPESAEYGDIYFSAADPLGETEHVFLRGNDLPARWAGLREALFTIGELGFGSGLNFLCAWRLWHQLAPPGVTLHYIACEKHPVTPADLARLHGRWPPLADLAARLQAHYPAHGRGPQRLLLDDGPSPVILDLWLAPADTALAAQEAAGPRVDAWFLDGFAPARNPAMWAPGLMARVARLSRPGASAATYSVAGDVRRALAGAGFELEKAAGFAGKRHMLKARHHAGGPAPRERVTRHPAPWFILPEPGPRPRRVAVIGAGMAGCATAWSLARRGFQVTLIEREEAVARGASGNPRGILYLNLARRPDPAARLALQAFLHARRVYRAIEAAGGGIDWHESGLLQIPASDREASRWRDILAHGQYPPDLVRAADAAEASELAGIPLTREAIFLPCCGWLDPAALCRAYVNAAGIRLLTCHEALSLERGDDQWRILGRTGASVAEADAVVVANSRDAGALAPCRHYPLIPVRGQLTLAAPTRHSAALRRILCGKGYLLPAAHGHHVIGGSFTPDCDDPGLRPEDHEVNLAALRAIDATLYHELETAVREDQTAGRAAVRCATPDRMPLAGPVEDRTGTLARYGDLARNAGRRFDQPGCYQPDLYINVGHGAHGLTTTPLLAEYLASLIAGEALPLEPDVVEALHPVRFLIRQLKRQEIGPSERGGGAE